MHSCTLPLFTASSWTGTACPLFRRSHCSMKMLMPTPRLSSLPSVVRCKKSSRRSMQHMSRIIHSTSQHITPHHSTAQHITAQYNSLSPLQQQIRPTIHINSTSMSTSVRILYNRSQFGFLQPMGFLESCVFTPFC
jgi:hypothetical protein